jgi:hypothetical protein
MTFASLFAYLIYTFYFVLLVLTLVSNCEFQYSMTTSPRNDVYSDDVKRNTMHRYRTSPQTTVSQTTVSFNANRAPVKIFTEKTLHALTAWMGGRT